MTHTEGSEIIRASLWIRPTGDARDRVQKIINEMRRISGAQESKPHVSLLGGIETTLADAQRKLKALADRLQPFEIRLGRIEWRDEYFRCLFIGVELTPELAQAQRLAHEVFEMNPPDPFEPHISLLYGDLDAGLKRRLVDEVADRIELRFMAESVHLVNASPGVAVADWRTLSEAAFHPQTAAA